MAESAATASACPYTPHCWTLEDTEEQLVLSLIMSLAVHLKCHSSVHLDWGLLCSLPGMWLTGGGSKAGPFGWWEASGRSMAESAASASACRSPQCSARRLSRRCRLALFRHMACARSCTCWQRTTLEEIAQVQSLLTAGAVEVCHTCVWGQEVSLVPSSECLGYVCLVLSAWDTCEQQGCRVRSEWTP